MNRKQMGLLLCAGILGILMALCVLVMEGILRIILLAVAYVALMEVVMTVLRNEPEGAEKPMLSKEEKIKAEDQWYFDRQDPAKMYDMRRVGVAMHVIAAVPVVMSMTHVLSPAITPPIWGLLCGACSAASVVLCAIWPAYFSIVHSEKEKNRKHHFPIVNLTLPFVCPLFPGICYEYDVCLADWVKLAEIILLMGAVLGAVMRLLVAECRRSTGSWAISMFFLCATLIGFVMPLNQALETEEPLIVSGVVTDYDRGGRRTPSKYEVQLDSGEEVRMPVNRRFYDYEEGDRIELEYHDGGLGIAYYCYRH